MYTNPFLSSWSHGGRLTGAWSSLPDPIAAEILGRTGFDYVCIDQQHGMIDDSTMFGMLQAVDASGAAPMVRVRWNEPPAIMSALDAGAAAVMVPMIQTRADAEAAVRSFRFPPRGMRSYGPTRARDVMGSADPDVVEQVACVVMVETREALADLDAIVSTPGVDAVYVGPSDLALALGEKPGCTSGPFVSAVESVRAACQRHGVAVGIHNVNGPSAQHYLELGFDFVTVISDAVLLATAARIELDIALTEPGDSPTTPPSASTQ